MGTVVKGYKVFKPDWTCRGYQYKVGETFVYTGFEKIEPGCIGFHFSVNPRACFSWYEFDIHNKVAEVEALGEVKGYTDECKVTDKLRIVRELTWEELLALVQNTGIDNIGCENTGNRNVGNRNVGNSNVGSFNVGKFNIGNENTGSFNLGHINSGNGNDGNGNTGNFNIGHGNTGNWNKANHCTGFFSTISQPIYMFNKPTKFIRLRDVYNLRGVRAFTVACKFAQSKAIWVREEDMSEDEKAVHPEYKHTGGYRKDIDVMEVYRKAWEIMSEFDRETVKALPNFDAEVFKEITGIDVNK